MTWIGKSSFFNAIVDSLVKKIKKSAMPIEIKGLSDVNEAKEKNKATGVKYPTVTLR